MKKVQFTLISCIILASTITSYSQKYLEKGSFMIGGGVSFRNSENETNHTNYNSDTEIKGFGFSPYIGRFVKDDLILGVKHNYNKIINTSRNVVINPPSQSIYKDEGNRTIMGINVFVRKLWSINEKLGVFIQPNIGFSNTNDREESFQNGIIDNKSDYDYNTISLSTNLGMYYFISDRFSIETTLVNVSYQHSLSKENNYKNNSGNIQEIEVNHSSFFLHFVNTISFDQLFTINYYF